MTDWERKVFASYDTQEPDDYSWEHDEVDADEAYESFMAEAEMVRAERE